MPVRQCHRGRDPDARRPCFDEDGAAIEDLPLLPGKERLILIFMP